MKKILLLLLITVTTSVSICHADDDVPLYGTPNNPLINGKTFDIHKPYIETNQGYGNTLSTNDNSSAPEKAVSKQIIVKQSNEVSKPINFRSDSWATDSKVEKQLKIAASEGKLSYVLDEAKKANVPASVATVAIVESNYNKNAVSPKGAGGAWQLMPGTANDYGLSSTDRFDFNSSTKVAIQILNDLHNVFGNWALAFAAYNCGERCVTNAIKKNPNAKDIDELSLPNETKQYVHKIVQLNQIIAGLDKPKKD